MSSTAPGAPRSYAAALRGTGARTSTDTGQAAEFHPAASAEPPSAATTPGPGPAAVDAAALSPSAPAPASPSAPASPQPACNVAHPAGHVSPRDMTSAPTNFERHPSKTTETQLAREQHQGQEQPQPPQQQQQTPTGRDIPDDGVPADSVEERGAGSRGGIAPEEDMHLLTRALDAGCSLLQSKGPVNKIHQHVCAFHMYAHDATRPVRAHHYCAHRSQDMRQCVLYDSDQPDARLIGIEYIVSRKLFESLPVEERKFWHSHVYEVQSGMLVAPGVPSLAEDADMRQVINTYGKIWHTWQVDRGDPLPLGPPQLMMAYTADGQLPAHVVQQRDRDLGVQSEKIRHRRRNMVADPPEPHPDADHPWRSGTGTAWQCVMQQVPFVRPPPPRDVGAEAAAGVPAQGAGADGGKGHEVALPAGGEAAVLDTLRPAGERGGPGAAQ